MLVLSGLLVLLALGLLVGGLAAASAGPMYLSIGTSLVAMALIAGAVRQRRPRKDRDNPPAGEAG